MRDSTESERPEPIVSQVQLQSAYLIRFLSSEQRQRFILEDVSARKRRQFEDLQALLVHLQEVFAAGAE